MFGTDRVITIADLQASGNITPGSGAGLWVVTFGPKSGTEMNEEDLTSYTLEHLFGITDGQY